MLSRFKSYKYHFTITLVWLIVIAIINPIGDFPLNDDWSYAYSVFHLINENEFKILNWGEMTLIGHVFMGYTFCSLFGASYTVLRISNLFLSLIGLLVSFQILKRISDDKFLALIGISLIAFNPVYLCLSFSYMTDVPFYTWFVTSILFFLIYLENNKISSLLWAVFFCFLALMIRQLAVVLPFSWLLFGALRSKSKSTKAYMVFVLPLVFIVLFYLIYHMIMQSLGFLQPRINTRVFELVFNITNPSLNGLKSVAGYGYLSLVYLGLFFLPFYVFIFKNFSSKIYIIAISLLATGVLFLTDKLFPSLNNVLVDFGVGPMTLTDNYGSMMESPPPNLNIGIKMALTFLGGLAGITFLVLLFKKIIKFIEDKQKKKEIYLMAIIFLVYLMPFLFVALYDRYLLPLFIPFVYITLSFFNKFIVYNKLVLIIGTVIISCFSIIATHDYLAWNRTRWVAIEEIIDKGTPYADLDGGVEYLTTFHFEDSNHEWWKSNNGKYKLGFVPNSNQIVIDSFYYDRWFPGNSYIYLLKNQDN